MSQVSEAARPPKPPVAVAQITATSDDGAVELSLTGSKVYSNKALAADASAHLDDATSLDPKLVKGDGSVLWLTGYRLTEHDAPGDTMATFSLLIELPASGTDVKALWHENHQQVPTSLFLGAGTLTPAAKGASTLSLQVKDAEYGDSLRVEGLLHR